MNRINHYEESQLSIHDIIIMQLQLKYLKGGKIRSKQYKGNTLVHGIEGEWELTTIEENVVN